MEINMNDYVEIPCSVTDGISYYFCERKGHRKARRIKAIKRRFIKRYGKCTEWFFNLTCMDITAWKW